MLIVPAMVARSPSDFGQLLASEGVTQLSQTPSAFLRLMEGVTVAAAADTAADTDTDTAAATDPAALAPWAQRLRHVVFGGEALDPATLKPWFRHRLNPAARLINMYGITETTVHVTWREVCAADVEAGAQRRNVGRPLADLSAYILDAHGEPQPVGVAGELYIGGAGLARWMPDGEIDYLGRLDHQVKIHGYRIELGEIEARLGQHPAISACAVLALQDPRTLQDRLHAWFVASEPLSAAALRQHLARSLPEYMLPHGFNQLEALPLTANGKLDRARLSAQFASRPQLDSPYVMPETAAELALARIWSTVLGGTKSACRTTSSSWARIPSAPIA